jgi:hypothetical protein
MEFAVVVHFICTWTGAMVWALGALILGLNAIVWLWTRFLEAAGQAVREKDRRDLAKHQKHARELEQAVARLGAEKTDFERQWDAAQGASSGSAC